jgi:hypothetical protein
MLLQVMGRGTGKAGLAVGYNIGQPRRHYQQQVVIFLFLISFHAIIDNRVRGYGEIGRRTRFRFWRRKAWGFKSLYPHHNVANQISLRCDLIWAKAAKPLRRLCGF